MNVLVVTGGRDFADRAVVFSTLDMLSDVPFTLYHGACRGADLLAADWARSRGIPCKTFPADWSIGRAAGQIRNWEMVSAALSAADEGCIVVAFPGGRGTAGCVSSARALGIPVIYRQ